MIKNVYSLMFVCIGAFLLNGCMRSGSRPPEAGDTLLNHENARRRSSGKGGEGSDSFSHKGRHSKDLYARGFDGEGHDLLSERDPHLSLLGAGNFGVPVYLDSSRLLKTTFFDFDDASLSPESRQVLKGFVAEVSLESPAHKILVVGRADWFGSEDYNMSLGDRRARAVVNYLTSLGVGASHMELRSRGKLDATPGRDGDSKSLSAKDRRVDIYRLWD